MSLKQSIRDSSKWLVGSNLVSQILQFVFGVILARLLVPADFGMIVTIQIFTGFVSLVASGGLGQALIRSKEAGERDFQVVFSVQLAVGVVIYTAFFLISPWFAEWFGSPLYEDLLRISAISFLMRPFLNMHNVWLHREMRFKATSAISLAANLLSGVSSIAMAMAGFGVWSLVLSGLLGSILNFLLLMRTTPMRSKLVFDRRIAQKHSGFGIKITLNDFISYMRHQTSNFILTKLAGPTTVGLFNKGDSLAKLPFSTISGPIYQPVFRSMAAEQDNPDRIKYLYFRMVSLLLLYTMPIYVGMWWLAEPLIITLYGTQWAGAAIPLEILSPLGFLYCIGHPCGAVLGATNRVGREVVVQTVTWLIVGVGCYAGLQWGLAGVSFGIVLSQLYSTTHMYLLSNAVIKATPRELISALAPGVLLNSVLVVALILIDAALPIGFRSDSSALYILVSAALGGLAYAAAFLFLPMHALHDEAQRWKKTLRIAA